MGIDKNYVPEIGDQRYSKFYFKPTLDIIRIEYYKKYGKDPSINPSIDDNVMFTDPSLPISREAFCFRGKFPFKIYLQKNYENNQQDNSRTIAVKFAEKNFNDENLIFIFDLISKLTGKSSNLIVYDFLDNYRYTVSFISQFDMLPCYVNYYYDFFERLCDNNYRNIIYIGDDLKYGVKVQQAI